MYHARCRVQLPQAPDGPSVIGEVKEPALGIDASELEEVEETVGLLE
jgi:hypothetical protein